MTTDRQSSAGGRDSTASSLLIRIKARDPQAWRRLADLYGPLVYHWCRSDGLQAEDAADVFQEVFAAVSKAVDGYLHGRNGGTFRGWLWTITRNKIRDHHRARAQRVTAAGGTHAQQRLAEVPEPSDESIDTTHVNETASLFHRALDFVRGEFEERTWRAFWRAVVEGHSTAEIAADMGITANAVRQAKSRVLRRLRQELGDVV